MPEIAIVGDYIRARHRFFRYVRDKALDAEQFLGLGLKRRIEHERLVFLFQLLYELGAPAGAYDRASQGELR